MRSTVENFDASMTCESCTLCSVHVNCCTFLNIRGEILHQLCLNYYRPHRTKCSHLGDQPP